VFALLVEASLIGLPTPHISVPEGTSVFRMGARVHTHVISSLPGPVFPVSRLPATACSGSVPGLPLRSTGLVSHN
jgi:hypothetical protein